MPGRATHGPRKEELGPRKARLLEGVTMDMAPGYIASTKTNAPRAEIVFDRFHVEQHLAQASDARPVPCTEPPPRESVLDERAVCSRLGLSEQGWREDLPARMD